MSLIVTFVIVFFLCSGQHMKEAVNINLGLLSLKKCIEAINNKASYVPYQVSKYHGFDQSDWYLFVCHHVAVIGGTYIHRIICTSCVL